MQPRAALLKGLSTLNGYPDFISGVSSSHLGIDFRGYITLLLKAKERRIFTLF